MIIWIVLAVFTRLSSAGATSPCPNDLAGALSPPVDRFVEKMTPVTDALKEEYPPAPDPFLFKSTEKHEVKLLPAASAALEMKLEMIERAKESIDLEYFIFSQDRAGKFLLQALVDKMRRMKADGKPFHIRLLLDYMGSRIDPVVLSELRKEGLEVKYYNPGYSLNLAKMDHRDHRKNFIIDGNTPSAEIITGSRNIADEYTDLSHKMNFKDLDIWVKGKIANSATSTFEAFWNHPLSKDVPIQSLFRPKVATASPKGKAQAEEFYRMQELHFKTMEAFVYEKKPEDEALLGRIRNLGRKELEASRTYTPGAITWISDKPGRGTASRVLAPFMVDQIDKTTQTLCIENYCFIPDKAQQVMLKKMIKNGVKVELTTNSFEAEEIRPVSVFSYYEERKIVSATHGKMEDFRFDGQPGPKDQYADPAASEARQVLHAKVKTFDSDRSFVGTPNWDPRSRSINAESGVLFEDSPEIKEALSAWTEDLKKQSFKMDANGIVHRQHPFNDDESPLTEKIDTPGFLRNVKQWMVLPFKKEY